MNMTHISKIKLNLKTMVTNTNIGKKMMLVSSAFHLKSSDFCSLQDSVDSERNQTPTSLSRRGKLLTQISEKSRVRSDFSHG